MPRLVARLIISVCMLPILAACFGFSVMLAEEFVSRWVPWSERDTYTVGAILAVLVGWGLVGLGLFWLTWRKVVCWNQARKERTLRGIVYGYLLTGASAAMSLLVLPFPEVGGPVSCVLVALAPALILIFWMFAWTESPRERAKRLGVENLRRVLCPNCKYDLSGLTNLSCPECGHHYTLGTLIEETRKREVPTSLE
ncbi:MAG TPA: hypothetical protein PL072_06255 [Phycisphaerales bacterium]|nr:hypothetical protein [Phycisphaerales bacterium]